MQWRGTNDWANRSGKDCDPSKKNRKTFQLFCWKTAGLPPLQVNLVATHFERERNWLLLCRQRKNKGRFGHKLPASLITYNLNLSPCSLPQPLLTMPEQQAADKTQASKSKHGHATSQAAPAAPRKVRFNVGTLAI